MRKYSALWMYIRAHDGDAFKLTFEEIQSVAGVPIDHSFLNCKKELTAYGWQVGKISLKEQTISFQKL